MSKAESPASASVRTQLVTGGDGVSYAFRRIGSSSGLPLLFLQHFTGTMDNWDRSCLLDESFYRDDFRHKPTPRYQRNKTWSGASYVT